MKRYLLFFFFILVSLPTLSFSQENENENVEWDNHARSPEQHNQSERAKEKLHDFDDKFPIDEHWNDRVEKESDTFQSKFFQMLYILALLIGFMFLASWALKRMMKNKIVNLNTSSDIKVLETRYLSPRATLYIVEIQDKTFLIGESPTSVSYLAELNHLPANSR